MSSKRKSIFACSPATTRGQSVALSADPANEHFAYGNGRTIIIRNLANPSIASEYTEHSCAVTVAKWSPSGYYMASGDVQGNVRIWDTSNEEHILKSSCRPISSRINDICWDSESKRLIAVGDGKERFGHAFTFDSNNSCGEILGHSKPVNSCTIGSVRPYRAATAGDDMTMNFYHGPPFKFAKSVNDHSRFIQSVRFSPNGQVLASAGSDGKIFFYNGNTGEKIGEILDAHGGGIFSLSWSADSKHFVTSSGDCTVKFWDAETRQAVNTVAFSANPSIDDQQVGNLWAGSHILSVSLSGDINYISPSEPKPLRIVRGHQKGITAFAINPNEKTFFTGSYDGKIYQWDSSDGSAHPITGNGHTNEVSSLALADSKLFSAGKDDFFREINISRHVFETTALATESEPKSAASYKDLSVVVTSKDIFVVKDRRKISKVSDLEFVPTCVAISIDGTEVAVGGEDSKVHLYSLSNAGAISPKLKTLESNRGCITALAYSPDGNYLAVADADRKVLVYDNVTRELKLNQWVFHNARVNCVSWSPDSLHAVSGGLDRDIYVWSTEKPMKFIAIKGAHQEGVFGVGFLDNNTIVSAGHDACVKTWSVEYIK